MSVRTPTEVYYKSRRLSLVVSGALAIAVVIGVKPSAENSLTIGPLAIADPHSLTTILFVVLLYSFWQFFAAWAIQDQEVQKFTINKIDFAATYFLSAGASFLYLASLVPWKGIEESLPNLAGYVDWISVIAPALGTVILANGILTWARMVRARIDKTQHAQEISISQVLTRGPWVLWFNPANPRANKQVTFRQDGEIGDGKNKNEHTWRIQDGLLELLNDQGKVFSRFRYDPETKQFNHTNDSDTLSIRSQVMFPVNRGD